MVQEISPQRKTLYYVGMGMMAFGSCLFFLAFISMAVFGFQFNMAASFGSWIVGVVAIVLVSVGGAIMGVGAKGLAGSGLILDPKQAREDLEPFTRMGGGMIKDALDGADIDLKGIGKKSEPEQVVKVRCPNCRHLNTETAKFCNECGKEI